MLQTLEGAPVSAADLQKAQAIVVLGGGRYRDPPEYELDTVSEPSLVRLRYAARLQRKTGLPILVSGGLPDGGSVSEADAMKRALEEDLGARVQWVEGQSNNTNQSARDAARLLGAAGIQRILLVTHAWHMPRSVISFSREGLDVIAAPTAFNREPHDPLDYLPTSYKKSRNALHEWIGFVWYRLRGKA